MQVTGKAYKFIFAAVVSWGVFFCGYNFKQWYAAKYRIQKQIVLVYSASKDVTGYESFERVLQQEYRKQGIEPVLDRYYLDCTRCDLQNARDHVQKYLDILRNSSVDLILVVGDQATSALLSTGHRLLYTIPVVACNVHFPDEKRINDFGARKMFVLRDRPDFQRNMEFIRSLQPQTGVEIVFNIDLTPLGRQSFDLLSQHLDRNKVRILGRESAFSMEDEYREMQQMTEYYDLLPAQANNGVSNNGVTVSLYPFRYIKGTSLLSMMEQSKSDTGNKAFLLDKSDMMALPIVNSLNIPSFSCIREGFGEESKIVGGYMATDEITARAAVGLSVRLMNNEKVGMPRIRDLDKDYVINWSSFSAYGGFDFANVPKNVQLINYPFYDRYRKELYGLAVLFIVAFIFLSVTLLRTRRRARAERKNMQILEEAHKRLTFSTDGGQVILWNVQGEYIEFDDNFQRFTGIKSRLFKLPDLLKHVYPDDLKRLNSFYGTNDTDLGMQIQRIRLCFGEKDDYQWYELRWGSLQDVKGGTMLAGIMHNIEELVKHEQELIVAKQIAEKAELKQSFLNHISHQIRTPLNAIVGFTHILNSEVADELSPDEKENMLDTINLNNELLLKIIDDTLEISHLDSSDSAFEMQEWDMTEIVKELYKEAQPSIRPELQFRLELDETMPLPVCTDRARFKQVIRNFLNNANKFTDNGHITLGCNTDRERLEVCVYVEDTGKGIAEKELLLIFDRFYKTDEFEQGSGLGLPICKIIAERLSGRIEVDSELGKGSRFSVILSYENEPESQTH